MNTELRKQEKNGFGKDLMNKQWIIEQMNKWTNEQVNE